ncbi:hypothetical protein [Saccharopolyspora griseoalba]|uniref:SsgA family sporulation/cell division regulator n=1 Tax=Saccharopolyspora griseoalba TaxID=1431848 RepID=A0ABW2LVE0_9PSEU
MTTTPQVVERTLTFTVYSLPEGKIKVPATCSFNLDRPWQVDLTFIAKARQRIIWEIDRRVFDDPEFVLPGRDVQAEWSSTELTLTLSSPDGTVALNIDIDDPNLNEFVSTMRRAIEALRQQHNGKPLDQIETELILNDALDDDITKFLTAAAEVDNTQGDA